MKKKKMNAMLSMTLAVALGASLLAGCQSQPSENDEKDEVVEAKDSGGVIDLNVLVNWPSTYLQYEPLLALADEWNAAGNYNVAVEGLPSSDARTKISVSMAAGDPADLSWCTYNYAIEYAEQGLLMDWSEVYENPKYADYFSQFSDAALYAATDSQGRVFMAPCEITFDGLFCNMEVFNKYGWELPETWEDLLDLCKKCNEVGVAPLVTGGADLRFAWLASAIMARVCGVENIKELTNPSSDAITSWNDPEYGFVESMTKFKELVDAGGFANGTLGLTMSDADHMFVNGEAAMYYEGTWKPADFEKAGGEGWSENVVRVDFPDIAGCDNDVNIGGVGSGFFIPANISEEKKEAAIEFYMAFNNAEFMRPIVEGGGFVWAGKLEYDENKVLGLMNQMIAAYNESTAILQSIDALAPPDIELTIKETAMPGILSGEMTVEEACDAVNDAAEQYVSSKE